MNWIPFFDDQYPVRTFYTDKEDYEKSGSGDSDSYMQYLQDARGIRARQVVPAFETHCASVYVVDQETDHMGNAGEKNKGRLAYVDDSLCVDGPGGYDSVVTSVPGIMLTIRTADCTPVYLYDPAHHVAAMVHSGWRGTLQKISVNTIRVMKDLFHTEPGQVIAAFGPCICGHCYEVGADLLDLFRDRYEPDEIKRIFNPREETGRISPKASLSGEGGKYLLDVKEAIRLDLVRTGLNLENIYDPGICTYESIRYASYRRDGKTPKEKQILSGIILWGQAPLQKCYKC